MAELVSTAGATKRPVPPQLVGKGFKPGHSGNPNGRPKGFAPSTLLAKRYASAAKAKELIDSWDELIRSGNAALINQMIDRWEGARTQEVNITVTIEGGAAFEIACNIMARMLMEYARDRFDEEHARWGLELKAALAELPSRTEA